MHFPNGVSLSLSLFIILVSRSVWPSWFMGDGMMIVWNARRYTLHRYPHARRTSAHRYTEHECFRMRFHLNMMRKRLMTIYTIISLHITNSALLLDIMIFMFGRWCKRAFSYPFPFLFHSTSNIEFASFAIRPIVCAASFFFCFFYRRHSVIIFLLLLFSFPWICYSYCCGAGPCQRSTRILHTTWSFSHGAKHICWNT